VRLPPLDSPASVTPLHAPEGLDTSHASPAMSALMCIGEEA
jgi:hypothetical protein